MTSEQDKDMPEQVHASDDAIKTEPTRIENIAFSDLSPNYPMVSAITGFLGWAMILLVITALHLFVPKVQVHYLFFIFLATIALLAGFYGYFAAKACGYYKGEFDLVFKQGLWWKKQTALSYSRIQHIDITHGPIERKYKMATIKFFTAGGSLSDLKIPGLPKEKAEAIRKEILSYAKENYENEISQNKIKPISVDGK